MSKDHGTTKYKVRLIEWGFTQILGRDYTDTYAPVVREEAWRLVLAYGISQELSLQLYDVESTYFNANLEEEIYVQDPILTGQKA